MERQFLRILLIEDNLVDARLIRFHVDEMKDRTGDLEHAQRLDQGLAMLAGGRFDVILLDLGLPDSFGLETLQAVHRQCPDVPIVVLTSLDLAGTAVEAMKTGAEDYLVKGRFDGQQLLRALQYAVERAARRRAESALAATNQTLRRLASELTLTEQRERRRLAVLLHENLQQLLVAVGLKMDALARHIREGFIQEGIREIHFLLDRCIAESRSLTAQLSPPVLYDAGLAAGLQWLSRRMEQEHQLSVTVDAAEEAEPAAEATRVFLFHAVRELLLNVVKHARTDSARVAMTRSPDGRIRIEVRDEGIGFDTAQRGSQETVGGFGLFGLRERLETMGGRLEVDSAAGEGTRIVLVAPREDRPADDEMPGSVPRQAATAEEAPPDGPAEPARSEAAMIRVLLADDHPLLRRGLVNLLCDQPAIGVVGEAGDGQEAVDLALRTRPDVILMDVTMPRLNGIEATRRITAQLPGVQVIGLSMHEDENIAQAMRDAGARAYLSKGVDARVLVSTIRAQAEPPGHK